MPGPPVDGAARVSRAPATEPEVAEATAYLDIGFVAFDRQWRLTGLNQAAERALAAPASDLVGRQLFDLFPDLESADLGRAYREVMQTRQPASAESPSFRGDAWIEVRILPAEDEGVEFYFLDITARRERARAVAQAAQRAELLSSLGDTLRSLDVRDNISEIARLVVPYLGTWAVVMLRDGGSFTDVGSWHEHEDLRDTVAEYAALLHGSVARPSWASRVIGTQEVVHLEDAYEAIRADLVPGRARDLLDTLRPECGAIVPMCVEGEVVGVLSVFGVSPWTPDQEAVAGLVVQRASLATSHAMLYAREQRSRRAAEDTNRWLSLLTRVSDVLAQATDTRAMIRELTQALVPELADYCMSTILDYDGRPMDVGVGYDDPTLTEAVDTYLQARRRPGQQPQIMTRVIAEAAPIVLPDLDLEAIGAVDPVERAIAEAFDAGSAVVYPLQGGGRALGAMSIVNARGRAPSTPDEIAVGQEIARRASTVLAAARAAQRTYLLAESIQHSLLVTGPPPSGLEVGTRYRPAYDDREIGGDWYDVFTAPDGATTITIGDVMGHDARAIAAMAQVRTAIRTNAWTLRHSPAEILTTTDQMLAAMGTGLLTTTFVAELQAPLANGSTVLRWANAGHPPPILVSPDGTALAIDTQRPDPPLGVAPELARASHTLVLDPGATLLLYTDGLIERPYRAIDEGVERLRSLLDDLGALPLPQLLDAVLAHMLDDEERADDVALLALRLDRSRGPDAG